MLTNLMKYKAKKDIIFYLINSVIFLIVGWILHYYYAKSIIQENSMRIEKPFSEITTPPIAVVPATIDSTKLDISTVSDVDNTVFYYERTMRSCLGSKCFDEPVNGIDRIGVLAPRLSGGQLIVDLLKLRTSNDQVNIIYDSNVPAYGYGKNHGWTRIIRLVRPIEAHAVALTIDRPDAHEAQIRQLMRWHCRISHVAAHTKLLTIFTDDLIKRPIVEMEKMLTFIGTTYDRHALIADNNNLWALLSEHIGTTSEIDKEIQRRKPITGRVIEMELNATQYLTKWPCLSFRSLEKEYPNKLSMKPADVSANCSDPFVTCSVPYDRNGG